MNWNVYEQLKPHKEKPNAKDKEVTYTARFSRVGQVAGVDASEAFREARKHYPKVKHPVLHELTPLGLERIYSNRT